MQISRFDPEDRCRQAAGDATAAQARHLRVRRAMDSNLERYLNDHLGGSAGAVDLIQTLAEHADLPDDREFFLDLKSKVEADRETLRSLLEKLGRNAGSLSEAVGSLTAKASRLKLMWEGLEPGRLGTFQAMEILSLGIQGKRLLWVILQDVAPWFPEWEGINFADLEREALAQRDSVERRRQFAGSEVLVDGERKVTKVQFAD